MATRTWIGVTDDSSVGSNWSGGAVPTSADDVVFNVTALFDCTLTADLSFHSMNCTGWVRTIQCANKKLKMFGGTLTIPAPLTVENCAEVMVTGGGRIVADNGTNFGYFGDTIWVNLVSGTLTCSEYTWYYGFGGLTASGGTLDFTDLGTLADATLNSSLGTSTITGVTFTNMAGKSMGMYQPVTFVNCVMTAPSAWALNLGSVATWTATGTTISNCTVPSSAGTIANFSAASNTDGGGNVGNFYFAAVSNVTSAHANGTFKAGEVIDITVAFTTAVTVTGTPKLTLSAGAGTNQASYLSGSGTSTLTFRYTVVATNVSADLDYAATSSLILNGGTINDAGGHAALLTLATPGAAGSLGANRAIVIDTTSPTVSNVTSAHANGSFTTGEVIDITVTFTESVIVTGTPTLALSLGSGTRTADYLSGSASNTLTFRRTIIAGDNSADLDYAATSSLSLAGGTILDAAGNAATLTLASPGAAGSLGANKAIVIDTTTATVVSVTTAHADGTFVTNEVINIDVLFTEAMTVTGTPQLLLAVHNGATRAVNYTSGTGTTTLRFALTALATDNFNVLRASSISLNGGTIKDGATNVGNLALPAYGDSGGLNANAAISNATPVIPIGHNRRLGAIR